jgi:hypothetical protein
VRVCSGSSALVDVCMRIGVCVSWTIPTCTKFHVHGTHKSQVRDDGGGVGRWRHGDGATSPQPRQTSALTFFV